MKTKKTIGIQIGAVSFVDEGVEPVLDILQEKAPVNTLFIAAFTYGRGIAGRQVPGQPLPDHGKQEYDTGTFHGGSYAAVHPQYYANTPLKDFRAPDLGSFDVFETVLPASRKRGMKNIAWFEDVFRNDIPGVKVCRKRICTGATPPRCVSIIPATTISCSIWWRTMPDPGISMASCGDRSVRALSPMRWARHGGGRRDPGRVTCFCEFCQKKGKERGIDVRARARRLLELEKFVRAARRETAGRWLLCGALAADAALPGVTRLGEFVARQLTRHLSRHVRQSKIGQAGTWASAGTSGITIRSAPFIAPSRILHGLRPYSDFLKIVMYDNCGGERLASYIESVGETQYGDVPKEDLLRFHYDVLGLQERRNLRPDSSYRLSSDYVFRETRRARSGTCGSQNTVWPGIDIDVPTAAEHSKSTPEGREDAVLAAFNGGADGVILSRKYSEMKLANLAGAGAAIRQLGLA